MVIWKQKMAKLRSNYQSLRSHCFYSVTIGQKVRQNFARSKMSQMVTARMTRQLLRQIEKLESGIIYRDILLGEVIHRTKNVLQLAVSTLGEAVDQARDPRFRRAVGKVQKQIVTLCQAQNRLFGPNVARQNLSGWVAGICSATLEAFANRAGNVVIATHVTDVALSRHQEVCLSLILQELLTNALKHAFPSGRQGTITVILRTDACSHCHLTVRDNGVGRSSDIAASTGLTLVRDFASVLEGSFTVSSGDGLTADVSFPLTAHALCSSEPAQGHDLSEIQSDGWVVADAEA
jgi:two-component sensor histidine kinase